MFGKTKRTTFAFLTIGVIIIAIIILAPRMFGSSRGMDYNDAVRKIDKAIDSTQSNRTGYPKSGADITTIEGLMTEVKAYFEGGEWDPGVPNTQYMYCTNNSGTLFVICLGKKESDKYYCQGPGLGKLGNTTKDFEYDDMPTCPNSIDEVWNGEGWDKI
jgi:hypothetical protein